MNKNLLIGLGVLIAVVVVGFLFVKSPKINSNLPQSNVQNTIKSSPSNEVGGKINEIKVSVKEFSYTPSTITVNKGEKVRITLTNDGTVSHNLSIEGLGISTKTIAPGESDSIDFTPNLPGSFVFFCTVDSHKDLGLTGTLEVK